MAGKPSGSETALLSELAFAPVPQEGREEPAALSQQEQEASCRQPPGLVDEEEEGGQEQEVVEAEAAARPLCEGGTCLEDQPAGSHSRWQEGQGSAEPCRDCPGARCPGRRELTPMAEEASQLLPSPLELEDGNRRTERRQPVNATQDMEPTFPPGVEDPALGAGERLPLASQPCCIPAKDGAADEEGCPICMEPYGQGGRRPDLLNCGHVLCGQCLRAIMEAASAADIGRVRCPICRQKTPMMEWEICKLQEELLLLSSTPSPAIAPLAFRPLPARRPGFWGGLEHHFQVRFHTSRMIGIFPCLHYPPCLISGLAQLEQRCRWAYLLGLLVLLGAEALTLLLIFLPIALLLLLFLILEK